MPKAVRINATGGPAVMRWEDYDPGDPGAGEVRLHQEAVGLNFIDVYHRKGLYPLPALPAVLGLEDAARAHQDLEGRKTKGSTIMIP